MALHIPSVWLRVDIGGTFTDVVLESEGSDTKPIKATEHVGDAGQYRGGLSQYLNIPW